MRRRWWMMGSAAAALAVLMLVPGMAVAQPPDETDAEDLTTADLFETVTAAAEDYDSVKVSWTLATGEPPDEEGPLTGFVVYWSDETGFIRANALGSETAGEDDKDATVDGLEDETQYFFLVAGVNADGTGAVNSSGSKTTEATATTGTAPPPAPPINVTAMGGDETFTVMWDAPYAGGGDLTIDHYRVQKREVAGSLFGEWIPEDEDEDDPEEEINEHGKLVAGNGNTITFDGLVNGTTYQARVLAVNSADVVGAYSVRDGDTSTPGDEAATVGAVDEPEEPEEPTEPEEPDDADADADADTPAQVEKPMVEADDGSLMIDWEAPMSPDDAPITDYSVRYMLKGGAWADQMHEGVMTETMIDGLINGSDYYVEVAAVNKNGMGMYSESAMGTPMMMDEEEPMETPALPLFGAFALGAGLLAAGRARLRRRELRAARVQGQLGR